MKQRRRVALILVGCAGVVAIVALAWWRGGEPTYRWRTLSQWLAVYSNENESEADSPEGKRAAEAADAIRHIGTNGLPFILKWMAGQPTHDEMEWFEIVGSKAAPAIPALTRMLNDSSQDVVRRAIYPLAYIGKEGLPPLVAALGNPANPDRSTIADAIRIMAIEQIDTRSAVPALIQCLKDTNLWVVTSAIEALIWAGRQQPEVAVPALIGCLKVPRMEVRDDAADCIGSFREKARPAVPALIKLLNDAAPHVRWAATNSLHKIAPEALTNGSEVIR